MDVLQTIVETRIVIDERISLSRDPAEHWCLRRCSVHDICLVVAFRKLKICNHLLFPCSTKLARKEVMKVVFFSLSCEFACSAAF